MIVKIGSKIFSIDFYYIISNIVPLFINPIANSFELAAKKKGSTIFLIDGRSQIGHVHAFKKGGWVQLIYISENQFSINVKDRYIKKVDYQLKLTKYVVGSSRAPPAKYYVNHCLANYVFFHYIEKHLWTFKIEFGALVQILVFKCFISI